MFGMGFIYINMLCMWAVGARLRICVDSTEPSLMSAKLSCTGPTNMSYRDIDQIISNVCIPFHSCLLLPCAHSISSQNSEKTERI